MGGWLIPDDGIGPIPAVPQTSGPGKVARILLVKQDVGDHAIVPLRLRGAFQTPATRGSQIKGRKAPGRRMRESQFHW